MWLKNNGQFSTWVQGLHRPQEGFNLRWMMRIVIHKDYPFTLDNVFESSFDPTKRFQCFFNNGIRDSAEVCRDRCCNGVFDVVKTRDTKLDMFYLTKSLQVELKKPTTGGNVAGK